MRNENSTSEKDDKAKFISVSLYDTLSSCTILRVTPDTIVDELMETILDKVEILPNDYKYYNLVMVVTGISDFPERRNKHCVRTLLRNEIVLDVESELTMKQTLKHSFIYSSIRWFFKDIRSDPLELGEKDDLIGGESSDEEEEEEEISLNDLSYVMQAEQSGYLLMRSSKNPNLWLQRFCILTDKLWCVNDRLKVPTASSIFLNSSTKVNCKDIILDCNGAIILRSNQGVRSFIASSSSDQQSWINELSIKAALVTDNDVIGMAEVIISDEESTRCQRMQRGMDSFLNGSAYGCSTGCICSCGEHDTDSVRPTEEIEHHEYCYRKNTHSVHNDKLCSISAALSQESNTILRIRTGDNFSRSYINEVQNKDINLYNALFFRHSVHVFKELFRLDLGITPEDQWKAVLEIFTDLLVPQFKRIGFVLANLSFDITESSEVSNGINGTYSSNSENHEIISCDNKNGNYGSSNFRKGDRSNNNSSKIQCESSDDKALYSSIDSSKIIALDSSKSIVSRIPLDVWKIIPSEVMKRLYNKASSQISKCDQTKEDKKNQKYDVKTSTSSDENMGYSRTPSAGGDESSHFGSFFGVEGLSNSSVAFASSSGHSLWNWTTRALRLSETDNDDDNASDSYRNTYWDGDVEEGGLGGKQEGEVVPIINFKDDHVEIHSNNNCGAYIFIPNCNISDGAVDTYYLKDRRIRPDLTIFDELCDKLKTAMSTT